eukprot:TRINITY_DN80966_c0_g1_i1.p1 TRINITY_DN80966_c0_g1~~TRINITY_DN80966_c0_g1_i1.p1  ORF type:complete len:370 (+),score=43.62 TRINITY_DN80966_c0_g1_i1:47-1156(+)
MNRVASVSNALSSVRSAASCRSSGLSTSLGCDGSARPLRFRVLRDGRSSSPAILLAGAAIGGAMASGGRRLLGVRALTSSATIYRRKGRRSMTLLRENGSIGLRAQASGADAASPEASLPWRSLEHIYCMNLDRRPERWEFMQKQFLRLRMPAQRLSAVDGKTLDVPRLAELGIIAPEAMPRYYLPLEQKLFGTDLTDGGIGCALSHLLIWKDIIERCARGTADENSVFLVIEDDCEFADGFNEWVLNERLKHVPADWEIVYLGGQDLLRRGDQYQAAPGVRRLYKGFRETTAYTINLKGAKACMEVCVPMYWQVDTHLNDESLRHGLRPPQPGETEYTMHPRGYYLWPPIVAQQRDGFPTDVQKVEHD